MSMKEIYFRYQALLREHSKTLGSIQAGIFSTTEAAIAIADLRGRMNNLQRMAAGEGQMQYAMARKTKPNAGRSHQLRQIR